MIRSIRNKGLRKLAERNDPSALPASFVAKIRRILAALNEAASPEDMNHPGFGNHPLRQNLAGFWSVTVSANYRIVYRMEQGDAYDLDLVDYH